MSICVVHLAWGKASPEALRGFLASYRAHDPGTPHRLVIAWNGFGDRVDEARSTAVGIEHEDLVVPTVERDLTVYRWVAEQRKERYICFLNSYSEILANGWLAQMVSALERPGVGIVGASGSYESAFSAAPRPLRLLRRDFPGFPNPHLRSNAFMLERSRMLELRWPRTDRKRAAWALESGVEGITAQVRAQGGTARVVGRDGAEFTEEQWPTSATFRSGEQENLLVADNRTRQYADADADTRRALRRMAWGDLAG